MSQAELAARADATRSVVRVCESGRRQPLLPTLMSLVEATGLHRYVELLDGPGRVQRREIASSLARRVGGNANRIRDAAAEPRVTMFGPFGSAARGAYGPDNGVILVDTSS